ncbi:ATP-binding cassette domain-containing protein [bacterium]|nr:ATP-binding cassette domain-containing protein [bacterium]HPF35333.1 ATP-binding cassette domain-containing protein [Candidatus Krumholzibacteria bacterium]HRX50532.1 ATP-binding cassette domain-containing protein [Candidatus Krumholzibacteria bacterium]
MIEVRGVTKRFGPTTALDDVSFRLEQGEILGFLGPNGAGKSTAMKIITTFLAPDAGSVTVDGIDVAERPLDVRGRIGYLPENNPLYVDMLVREYLDFVGRARGLGGARLKQRLDWVVDACGLGSVYGKAIHELSKGYKQRTGLAQALIHDPDVLILDEPTSGLDPLQIIGIRDLIQGLADEKTIIFSTHILQEVAPVTDRVVIINGGRIIADGRIGELERRAMGSNRLYVGVRAAADEAEAALSAVDGVESVSLADGTDGAARFEVRAPFGTDVRSALSGAVRARGWELLELHESPYSLEATFIALTRQARDAREVVHG